MKIRNFRLKKRGSLNLSIEAIVIIVIAFTVLGLGLAFVKGQFKTFTGTSENVQAQISQQILDDLRSGNKKLSFPTDKLTLATSEESVQGIGIKNVGDSEVYLKVGFQVKDNGVFVPFVADEGLDLSNGGTALISWDSEAQYLKAGESKVMKVTVGAPSKQGNYLYKIIVDVSDKDGNVINPDRPYDTQSFFIKTT